MEENNHQNFYENGSTQPPKSHGGLIAAVLCIGIILLGILSSTGTLQRGITVTTRPDGIMSFSPSDDAPGATVPYTPFPGATIPGQHAQVELKPLPELVGNVPQAGGISLQEIYQKNIPSVVSITCTFSTGNGSGTGVVLSENGYLVTNTHVIDGASAIEVLLTDGRTFSAQLVGADALTDLAVLYIEAGDLIPAEFGDSAQLRVGDSVVAIGDPLGSALRGTMTDGIVSAINRNVETNGRTMTLIQTNAALNSGNSGGPLINCHGQVIGINTMKIATFSDSAGVEGLGFAIPSVTVKEIADQLISQGYVSGRPALGLTGVWISSFHQQFRGLPAGLYITEAPEDSDIAPKDILLSIAGTRVTTKEELYKVLYTYQPGDTVTLTLYRAGRQYTLDITLKEAGA